MAFVARRVVEIEENFYSKTRFRMTDMTQVTFGPTRSNLDIPSLPLENRLSDVEVVMEGEPVERVLLFCTMVEGRMKVGELDLGERP